MGGKALVGPKFKMELLLAQVRHNAEIVFVINPT